MTKETKPTGEIVIRSVRLKRASLALKWTQGEDEYGVTFHENPLPSFTKAIAALVPHVCSLCELPERDADKIEATGITMTPNGENTLALITAKKRVKKAGRVFNIATPLLPMYADEENKKADRMEPAEAKAIEKVATEARKYIAGERAQGRINFGADDEPKKPKGDDNTPDFPALNEPKD